MPRPVPWWAVVSAALAPVALIGGWLVAAAVQPASYDPVRQTISVLAGHAAEHRSLMTAALAVVGGCHLVTAAGLRSVRSAARVLLAVAGVASVAVAVFAEPARGSSSVHVASAGIAMVALSLWPLTVAVRGASGVLGVRACLAAGMTELALLAWLGIEIRGGTQLGVAERAATAAQVLWPLAVVLAARRAGAPARATGRPAPHAPAAGARPT